MASGAASRAQAFQFHLVRLKGTEADVRPPPAHRFQFHLVRLKEPWRRSWIQVHTFQFHLVRLKDNTNIWKLIKITIFQFHLVRLKAGQYNAIL